MASKTFYLFPFICILMNTQLKDSVLAHSNEQKPSPIGFLRSLEGFKKGDKSKEIESLRKYFQYFGYLNANITSSSSSGENKDNDLFDENMELAVKNYQMNFNLKPSGILNSETIRIMSLPRCGVPDYVKGFTRMRAGFINSFHAHYAFLPGNPRWPDTQKVINYAFDPEHSRDDATDPVSKAFLAWSGVTKFDYGFGAEYDKADIKISFRRGAHGDASPFDGPGNVMAHSRPPPTSFIHFDADENWSSADVPAPNAIDIQTVALHEIGHTLGLDHSSVPEAIMYPVLPTGSIKDLNDDDIQGIKAIYGYS